MELNTFFISNIFTSNIRLKLAKKNPKKQTKSKKQAKSKQQHQAELLLFENYSIPSSMLSCKNSWPYSKKCAKNQVSV